MYREAQNPGLVNFLAKWLVLLSRQTEAKKQTKKILYLYLYMVELFIHHAHLLEKRLDKLDSKPAYQVPTKFKLSKQMNHVLLLRPPIDVSGKCHSAAARGVPQFFCGLES
jgi:hypothetical protein